MTAQTIFRPISNGNSLWTVNDYALIGTAIQPDNPGIPAIEARGTADNGERQTYNIAQPTRRIRTIRVVLIQHHTGSNNGTLDIRVNGVTETPVTFGAANDGEWESHSFTGEWSAADFAAEFQVGLTCPTLASLGTLSIPELYCECTDNLVDVAVSDASVTTLAASDSSVTSLATSDGVLE